MARCLVDGRDIPEHQKVTVFVRNKNNGDFRSVPEFMCIDHGSNGGNSLDNEKYLTLMANALEREM